MIGGQGTRSRPLPHAAAFPELIDITPPRSTVADRLQCVALAFFGQATPTICQVVENSLVLRVFGLGGHALAFLDARPAVVGGLNGIVLHGTILLRTGSPPRGSAVFARMLMDGNREMGIGRLVSMEKAASMGRLFGLDWI
jgi:hypothetical protein